MFWVASHLLPRPPRKGHSPRAREERLRSDLIEGPLRQESDRSLPRAVDQELVPAGDDIALAALGPSHGAVSTSGIEETHISDREGSRTGETTSLGPPSA